MATPLPTDSKTAVDQALADMRLRKDCDLRLPKSVSAEFRSNPPHRVGIAHLVLRPRFLLRDPTGTGKSPQALVAFACVREKAPTMRALVLTTKSAQFQWAHQAVPKFLKGIRAEVLGYTESGANLTPAARLDQIASPPPILVTTYQTAAKLTDELLETYDQFVLILDEVQAVRSTKQRVLFPNVYRLSQKARYVWGLTATPIFNTISDLYGVMEMIRPGTLGTEKEFDARYRERYLKTAFWAKGKSRGKQKYWHYTGQVQNTAELARVIDPFTLRRPAAEIDPHLPELVTQDLMVEMTPQHRAFYERVLQQHFPAGSRVQKVTAILYAQMATDAPELLGEPIPSTKLDELVRFLQEDAEGQKVIVYSRFRRMVDLMEARLQAEGIATLRITGRESAREREANKTRFNDPASHQDVVLITDAGGAALDLQGGSVIFFYDLPDSWGKHSQVLGRARRIGSRHRKVLAITLQHTNSSDSVSRFRLIDKEFKVEQTIGLTPDEKVLTLDPDLMVTPDDDVEALYRALEDHVHSFR